jgi:hypothetical protein
VGGGERILTAAAGEQALEARLHPAQQALAWRHSHGADAKSGEFRLGSRESHNIVECYGLFFTEH